MKSLTQEEFIKRAASVNPHLNFSQTVYTNTRTKVKVICPLHGEFEYLPKSFFKRCECPYCKKEKCEKAFIQKAQQLHNNKYDYSHINYINNDTPISINCRQHGIFKQRPSDHLKGYGCNKCSKKYKPTAEEWIARAAPIYSFKYDYSKVIYKDNKTPVTVICPIHGEFYPIPNNHVAGTSGCPHCINPSQNNLFEHIKLDFPKENIKYEYRPEWLGLQRFDIYFIDRNIAIEYDGIQHFMPVEHFGGESNFKKVQILDKLKEEKCLQNGCHLFRIKYDYSQEEYNNLIINIQKLLSQVIEST